MADHVRAKTRKDRIMDAALRIFAEKSFQDATISEISKEAGVSEATIYEYFGTKEDLLFAIPEKFPMTRLKNLKLSCLILRMWKAGCAPLFSAIFNFIRRTLIIPLWSCCN
jgi:AraC-like DNA-binding protein